MDTQEAEAGNCLSFECSKVALRGSEAFRAPTIEAFPSGLAHKQVTDQSKGATGKAFTHIEDLAVRAVCRSTSSIHRTPPT